ncbi:MAG: hypothetical protein ACJAYG_000896 [Oceanicoccus sp.]|jgi:uncharacterized protein YbgA (DUF1722 family)/uncharacterized protein YbbK (DUF523 family)
MITEEGLSETGNALSSRLLIGISSCLLGERVRFDSGHKNHSYISKTLSEYFDFRPFCPEVSIGLGIPRAPIRLVAEEFGGPVRCVGTKDVNQDVTAPLKSIAHEQFDWIAGLDGYIFKKDSPSCGMERVKVYTNAMPERNGVGIYTGEILNAFPNLPVEEEGRLGDAALRENFIKRVFLYRRWRELMAAGPSKKDLITFHARHKLIYMSHNQNIMREIGRLVAGIGGMEISSFCVHYLHQISELLRQPASRNNHANVLKHIQGYLKRDLDSGDRQELDKIIEQYRQGYLPLIVPITLLRHHFRKFPDEYIGQSWYMKPHPQEMMLHNLV